MRSLFLQQNMLTDLSTDAFKDTADLAQLNLSGNKLIVLQDTTFSSLFQLISLPSAKE